MDWKKVRINDLTSLSKGDNHWIEGSLESVDKSLMGVIPKMFYCYEIDKDSNVFVVVPAKYEDQVTDRLKNLIVVGIKTSRFKEEE